MEQILAVFCPFIGRVARYTPSSRPKNVSKIRANFEFHKSSDNFYIKHTAIAIFLTLLPKKWERNKRKENGNCRMCSLWTVGGRCPCRSMADRVCRLRMLFGLGSGGRGCFALGGGFGLFLCLLLGTTAEPIGTGCSTTDGILTQTVCTGSGTDGVGHDRLGFGSYCGGIDSERVRLTPFPFLHHGECPGKGYAYHDKQHDKKHPPPVSTEETTPLSMVHLHASLLRTSIRQTRTIALGTQSADGFSSWGRSRFLTQSFAPA